MEYVYFKDLLDKYEELDSDEFLKFIKENVYVNDYIGISKKYSILEVFNEDFTKSFLDYRLGSEIEGIFLSYDLQSMFEILFAYTNILVSENEKTTNNYDVIKKSGLYKYIYDICKEDYEHMMCRCEKITGINNIRIYLDTINVLNEMNDSSKYDINSIVYEINNIDNEKLKLLKDISKFNILRVEDEKVQ